MCYSRQAILTVAMVTLWNLQTCVLHDGPECDRLLSVANSCPDPHLFLACVGLLCCYCCSWKFISFLRGKNGNRWHSDIS
jgi:hypothetical protein